jgi:tetratricopeptide (TPR) repeat protein
VDDHPNPARPVLDGPSRSAKRLLFREKSSSPGGSPKPNSARTPYQLQPGFLAEFSDAFRSLNSISNRLNWLLETTASHRKYREARPSNRHTIRSVHFRSFDLIRSLFAVLFVGIISPPLAIFAATSVNLAVPAGQSVSPRSSPAPAAASQNPAELFKAGETALRAGNVDAAETAFQHVLAADPTSAGAYANLGVIAMRRQNWPRALVMLEKAAKFAPRVAGIRLNIGLVYYRQNDFQSAIAPFESVVRDQPDSVQAKYLLGLCYFFTGRDADAVRLLDGLWPQESNDLNYLYVLGNAANKSNHPDIEERALGRFVELGASTAEYHLLMGKAALNREEGDKAIAEFQQAAQLDPNLPYLHFNLGLAYLARTNFEQARDEFLKDVAIEPDVAFNYDRLGVAYSYLQDDVKAQQNFQQALRRDSHLASSYFGLARIYQRQQKFDQALAAVKAAEKIDPNNPNYHNLKGQILIRMGRAKEGQEELASATALLNASRERRQNELLGGDLPQPELSTEPKSEKSPEPKPQ